MTKSRDAEVAPKAIGMKGFEPVNPNAALKLQKNEGRLPHATSAAPGWACGRHPMSCAVIPCRCACLVRASTIA